LNPTTTLVATSTETTTTTITTIIKTKETNISRLQQRQKQIDIGKNTIGWHCFIKSSYKQKQKLNVISVPNKYQVCSKRSWDGQIKKNGVDICIIMILWQQN